MKKQTSPKQLTHPNQINIEEYDGLIFYPTINKEYTEYIRIKTKKNQIKTTSRTLCEVFLYVLDRTNGVLFYENFSAHFDDPSFYAHSIRKNTCMFGCILKKNEKSNFLIKAWKKDGSVVLRSMIRESMRQERKKMSWKIRFAQWWNPDASHNMWDYYR